MKPRASSDYEAWLRTFFPHVASKPLGRRHHRLWKWIAGLETGKHPRPFVAIWPRGGAKSTTIELGCAYVGQSLTRRFCLYVSETQDQADRHVQAVATLLEKIGVERSVNKYGTSKAGSWKRNQLRTAHGFNMAGIGLDSAMRGVKLDEFRPDLIVFDDIDNERDTAKAIGKKEASITSSIMPAGSPDVAILMIQNLIREDGIFGRIVSESSDWLMGADVDGPEPALLGLEYEQGFDVEGRKRWVITRGEPTWIGQDVATCEHQMNNMGPLAFLREAQHEVKNRDGVFFHCSRIIIADELPDGWAAWEWCRAYDLAATEGGGDWTVSVLMGKAPDGTLWIVEIQREQYGSDKVRQMIQTNAKSDLEKYGRITIRIPQDPGQAGKDQALQYRTLLSECGHNVKIEVVTGDKATRASGLQNQVNLGNLHIVKGPWSEHRIDRGGVRRPLDEFLGVLSDFREDGSHEHDDDVDAASDACNVLVGSTAWFFGSS